MKVLLLRDIPGVGRKNEIRTVPDGYGRNFLVARGLARVATEQAAREAAARHAAEERQREEQAAEHRAAAERAEGLSLSLPVTAGKRGEVWSPVRAAEIETALAGKGFKGVQVKLERPLKQLGAHQVEVVFEPGISAKITVLLIPS